MKKFEKKMVVLICGDRNYKNRRKIGKMVVKYKKRIALIVEGGAEGADKIAWEYGQLLGISTATLDANWTFFAKAAGPIRNRSMLLILQAFKKFGYRTEVWAFHSDLKKSKGTLNMVTIAREENILVRIFR